MFSIYEEFNKDLRFCEDVGVDLELKLVSRGKMGGKVSIVIMLMKRIYIIKLEKLKKKGNLWLSDCFLLFDFWLS